MNKQLKQLFLTSFLIAITILVLVMNQIWSHQRKQRELNDVNITISEGIEYITKKIPKAAIQVLPSMIENYFEGLGYITGQVQDIYQLRILEDVIEEEGVIIFRCFYEETDTNTLVVIYDGKFHFEVEEQME